MNNFDRLIVRLERNFNYLQNNASRHGTPIELSELNNALIAGWERLALLRQQINENENLNNDTNDLAEDLPRLNQPQPALPMPQLEYQDGDIRELDEDLVDEFIRGVENLHDTMQNNRAGVEPERQILAIDLPAPALPEHHMQMVQNQAQVNNEANLNLALEEHDDFEFVDSDSEDLINEETEDEDDISQGLKSLSDLHVLELEGWEFKQKRISNLFLSLNVFYYY